MHIENLHAVVYQAGGHYLAACKEHEIQTQGSTREEAIYGLAEVMAMICSDFDMGPLPDPFEGYVAKYEQATRDCGAETCHCRIIDLDRGPFEFDITFDNVRILE